jgi:hypothetical protein
VNTGLTVDATLGIVAKCGLLTIRESSNSGYWRLVNSVTGNSEGLLQLGFYHPAGSNEIVNQHVYHVRLGASSTPFTLFQARLQAYRITGNAGNCTARAFTNAMIGTGERARWYLELYTAYYYKYAIQENILHELRAVLADVKYVYDNIPCALIQRFYSQNMEMEKR